MTLPRRQTACRMRHCFARRIDECPVRRELLRTSTRSAERQRIIEAETSRIAEPMAASVAMPPRRHFHSGGMKVVRAPDCQSKPFSWGSKGDILFPWKENIPLNRSPARRRENLPPARHKISAHEHNKENYVAEGGYGAFFGKLRGKHPRAG